MSLTASDLSEIRIIIESALVKQTQEAIKPLQNEIAGLRDDIKEIYGMIFGLESKMISDKQFQELSLEEKLLKLNTELLSAAKQAGVNLPR